jgi:hypothetical protein
MKKRMWAIIMMVLFFGMTGNVIAASDTYDHELTVEDITFAWSIAGDSLNVRLQAKTDAWVGIGFNPTSRMKDANIIIGFVKDGEVTVVDHFGTAERGHEMDTRVGGKSNVDNISGKEAGGTTEISFSVPLNSDDPKDRPIWTNKPNTILLAHGAGRDSFRTKHVRRMVLEVNLQTGEFKKVK